MPLSYTRCVHCSEKAGVAVRSREAAQEYIMFIPWGLQAGKDGNLWCYIVDQRFYNSVLGINPGVQYVQDAAKYHAGDKIDLVGYTWTIRDCKIQGSFSFKRISLANGIPISGGAA